MRVVLLILCLGLAACSGDPRGVEPELAAEADVPLYPNETPELRALIEAAALENDVPVALVQRVVVRESTHRPGARNGPYYGLMQILPATARGYACNVGTGAALKNGAANLSCAVRIMAVTVPRDGVIYGRGGRGVAADWGPMRSSAKRADMAGWLRQQAHCAPPAATRPRARPLTAA